MNALFLTIVAGLIVGWMAFRRYFELEHRRLSLHESLWVWAADGVALAWLLVYVIRHGVLEASIDDAVVSKPREIAFWIFAIGSLAATIGFEYWESTSLRNSEEGAFRRSHWTLGTIESASSSAPSAQVTSYSLECRYTDSEHASHDTTFYVRDPYELRKLPPDTAEAIRKDQLPASVSIAYDPERQERAWLTSLGWESSTHLYNFVRCKLYLQASFLVVFTFLALRFWRRSGHLPWWSELHGVALLAILGVLALFLGTVSLAKGMPSLYWEVSVK